MPIIESVICNKIEAISLSTRAIKLSNKELHIKRHFVLNLLVYIIRVIGNKSIGFEIRTKTCERNSIIHRLPRILDLFQFLTNDLTL